MKQLHFLVPLFLVGCLCNNKVLAQSFILKGVVIEKGSNVRVALAKITNIRSKMGALSNEFGMFQLYAQLGDTLLLEKKNLTNQKIVVESNNDLVVYLIRESTILEDVTIKGDTKKAELAEVSRAYKQKGSFFGGKPPLILLIPFGGHPLTFFYELFGKTPAQARRFNRYAKKERELMEVDRFFNKSLVTQNTELKGKDLDRFLLNYYPSYSVTRNWNHYDAIKYIQESAKEYTDTLRNKTTAIP